MEYVDKNEDEESSAHSPASGLGFEITMSEIESGERRTMSFRVNANLHRFVKAFGALNDIGDGEIVNRALAQFLASEKFITLKP